jgi:hypothetical protein
MNNAPTQRRTPHRMLPIWVDEDTGDVGIFRALITITNRRSTMQQFRLFRGKSGVFSSRTPPLKSSRAFALCQNEANRESIICLQMARAYVIIGYDLERFVEAPEAKRLRRIEQRTIRLATSQREDCYVIEIKIEPFEV